MTPHHLLIFLVRLAKTLIGSGGEADLAENVELPRQHVPDVVVGCPAGQQVLDHDRVPLTDTMGSIL